MATKNRIIVPCRLAYMNCWTPSSNYNNKRYSLVALISKKDNKTIELVQNTIELVKEQSADKWGGTIPNMIRLPLHDGDVEKPDNPIFQKNYYLNAKSKTAPQIVDEMVNPIVDHSQIYAGCYGNVSLVFYPYNVGGNKGIGVALGNIQKIKDGPFLNGQVSAKAEFAPVTEETINNENIFTDD
ncbi:MAG: DUF2815 family protein [Eubacterium sp.]|nr:DUF2815 family protein [Eubacterium sp.]